MKTRYTVHYWHRDEHDTLTEDFSTLREARNYAKTIDLRQFKDILIVARHWVKTPYPLATEGWIWELADDNYSKYFNAMEAKTLYEALTKAEVKK